MKIKHIIDNVYDWMIADDSGMLHIIPRMPANASDPPITFHEELIGALCERIRELEGDKQMSRAMAEDLMFATLAELSDELGEQIRSRSCLPLKENMLKYLDLLLDRLGFKKEKA